MRKNNQNSSASSYRVQATTAIIDGQNIYPIFRTGDHHLRRVAAGVREDAGQRPADLLRLPQRRLAREQAAHASTSASATTRTAPGTRAASRWATPPRSAPASARRSISRATANGSPTSAYAQYVGLFVTQMADAASAAGRQASYSFFYQGPSVNTGATGPYLTSQQALQILFDWFNRQRRHRPRAAQPADDPRREHGCRSRHPIRPARTRPRPASPPSSGPRAPCAWTSSTASSAISTATSST